MAIYTIADGESGETCIVDTAEEAASVELFAFCDERMGPLDWLRVSYIEGATESLIEGKIAQAGLDLAALGLMLTDVTIKEN